LKCRRKREDLNISRAFRVTTAYRGRVSRLLGCLCGDSAHSDVPTADYRLNALQKHPIPVNHNAHQAKYRTLASYFWLTVPVDNTRQNRCLSKRLPV